MDQDQPLLANGLAIVFTGEPTSGDVGYSAAVGG
jgi:hypothetical protein